MHSCLFSMKLITGLFFSFSFLCIYPESPSFPYMCVFNVTQLLRNDATFPVHVNQARFLSTRAEHWPKSPTPQHLPPWAFLQGQPFLHHCLKFYTKNFSCARYLAMNLESQRNKTLRVSWAPRLTVAMMCDKLGVRENGKAERARGYRYDN